MTQGRLGRGAARVAVGGATTLMMGFGASSAALADTPPPGVPGDFTSTVTDQGVKGEATENQSGDSSKPPSQDSGTGAENAVPAAATGPRYEYLTALACSSGQLTPADATGGVSNCTFSDTGCSYETPPSDVRMYYYYRRPISGGPWELIGDNCNPAQIPAGAPAPPPTPTIGQIRQAFLALPFAKPTVNIQPEGDVTLVNLPTYFEAQWPEGRLGPGDISPKVQLLSWSIEFKIDPAEYDFDFGDGTSSGPTSDPGGPHPEGQIRHTYTRPNPAVPVKVDATLTGSYRVNGGPNWIPLSGVADLQDEPVVTLQVREAKARLYKG